jgi:hypothetical protein
MGANADDIPGKPYIPATLAVNQVSRQETLKKYQPIFILSDIRYDEP